jgi:anti-sigma regulatory factor (Ser/Thr protein kinase)
MVVRVMSQPAKVIPFPEPLRKRILIVGNTPEMKAFLDSDDLSDEISVERCSSQSSALRMIRKKNFNLVISCGPVGIMDDIAMLQDFEVLGHGRFKLIIVTPYATPEELIEAMRSHVFSVFSEPLDHASFADMIEIALHVPLWSDGIEVVSAKPEWIALRLRCSRITVERLVQFGRELQINLDSETREAIMTSFRELLLNAMEHGAKFDPKAKIHVGYLRTSRMVLYYVRDPGTGFELATTDHSALNNPKEDQLRHIAVRIEKGLRAGGFGIYLAKELMDDVVYNEIGNEVIIVKYQNEAEPRVTPSAESLVVHHQ